MTKLNPLQDSDFESKSYFGEGVHEIVIAKATRENPEGKAPFASFDVEGHDGEKANVRLYLSEAAAPYSLRTLGQIAVHNEANPKGKEAARDAFKKIDDTDLIDDKFLQKFVDMQAWVLTEEDTNGQQKPNGGYYLRSNLYSYPPKPRGISVEEVTKGGETLDVNEIPF